MLIDTKTKKILAHNGNRTIERNDPTAHAEIMVIREACQYFGTQRIPGTTLYVTLEPCSMCAVAIAYARIDQLIFGADDPKGGGVLHGVKFFDQPTCHHKINIRHGIQSAECSKILKDFFRAKRKKSH